MVTQACRVARGACVLAATVCSFAAGAGPATVQRFEIDDYFRLVRISELALSDDGRWLAYIVHSYSAGTPTREVVVRPLADERSRAIDPGALTDASDIAWIPGTHELAFLTARSGTAQVFSYDVASGQTRQRTRSTDAVEKFRYAPDGAGLAFQTRAAVETRQSLYEQFRTGTQGIVVDPRTTSSHDFLNPHWQSLARRPPGVLWVTVNGASRRVELPGDPADDPGAFFWSSDSRHLSILYVGSDIPASLLRDERTSLGVLDIDLHRFRTLGRATAPSEGIAPVTFKGGEWIPGSAELLVRRIAHTDPWVSDSFPDAAVVDGLAREIPRGTRWHALEAAAHAKFIPVTRDRVLVETTLQGVRSLFRVTSDARFTLQGMQRDPRVAKLAGSSSLCAFSADFSTMVFVNESLDRPPEIYVQSHEQPPRALTRLNAAVAAKLSVHAREVLWKSDDGVEIAGWLMEPNGSRPEAGWPLVTHVHGGPAFAYPDAFAPYFDFWPYPFEVYTSRGIAVFAPNYRGTHGYGRQVAISTSAAAIADIVSGVEHLVRAGSADPQRLGISGHSHGAAVGPLAMAQARRFAAASFAEGVANGVVMYELMSDEANREIHDALFGASLYDDPARYVAESADLRFTGLRTAALFEGGAHAAALLMLGYPKAAARAGMPTELVVYPRTGHNITDLPLRREAAQRNVDWFEFWLLGREDASPSRAAQYARWRVARSIRSTSTNDAK